MGAIKAQVFLPARNAPEQIAIQRFLSVSILDFGTVAGQTVAIVRKLGLAGTEVFGHQSFSVCRWVNPRDNRAPGICAGVAGSHHHL
jgi:hypothetical protein